MIKKIIFISFLFISTSINAFQFNLRSKDITVSGISSGAFFAHQFHIAFNSKVSGAAMFAGGPFYCAKGSSSKALGRCMNGKESYNLASESFESIKKLAKRNRVDAINKIKKDRVYIFAGMNDTVVSSAVPYQLKRLYHLLGLKNESISMVDDMMAGHTYPTISYGNPCATPKKSPFISSCNYDGAYESLSYLYPKKTSSMNVEKGELLKIDQTKFFKRGLGKPLMQESAYIYIPKFCENGGECDFHVAFHGCSQTVDHIETQYVMNTGINEAADKLNLIVLYPQAKKASIPGRNPYGCWDWWGHSGSEYHTKKGQQLSIVARMIQDLTDIDLL